MSGAEFNQIISVVGFLGIIWICGRLCKLISLSPLIGWIASGMIFGPQGIISLIHTENQDVWKLLGTLGVTLMIAESGTHIHFDKIKKVGLTAVFVALIGTFLPLTLGFILVLLFGEDNRSLKAAFAAGCSMAPTSVGVALKLLTEANQLNSLPGQTIVTAAFLDDVFSIILLVILQSFSSSNAGSTGIDAIFTISIKFLFCFLFLSIGVILAMYFFGSFIPLLLHYIPSNNNLNYQPRDELHLIIMILILISYSYIGELIGSHLLGAFIAGMSFSLVSRSMYVWRRQMKRLNQWLIKLFFACSVAFTIPTYSLFTISAFGKGLLFAIISGIFGKVLSGFVSTEKENKYIIGFAMVGRGEFAYLVAAEAMSLKLISRELYAIIVWSLLIAVIIAPIAFGYVLKISFSKRIKSGIKWFTIKVESRHHTGVHFEVVDVIHNLKLDILEAKVETDGDTDCSEFIVGVSGNDNLDKNKINDILHDIREAVGDIGAQIQLLPIDENNLFSVVATNAVNTENNNTTPSITKKDDDNDESEMNDDEYLLEIKLMSRHSPQIFAKLIEEIQLNGIQLIRGHMEDFLNTDSQVIFGKINGMISIRDIKIKLKNNVLKLNNINGEILVKKIHRDIAVLPHHIKFSELLQCEGNKNNPLLSNKIQNGYEIDICSSQYEAHLILSISNIFESLDLDIRTIHIQINEENNNFISSFFVQESIGKNISNILNISKDRRNNIEFNIAQIFENKNIATTIKTKTIEMGKQSLSSTTSTTTKQIIENNKKRPKPIYISSPSTSNTNTNTIQSLAAITESIIIITPKRQSTLPPSIEKTETETTFNLIDITLLDTNNNNNNDNDNHSNHSSNNSTCSIIDILNE